MRSKGDNWLKWTQQLSVFVTAASYTIRDTTTVLVTAASYTIRDTTTFLVTAASYTIRDTTTVLATAASYTTSHALARMEKGMTARSGVVESNMP